MKKKFSIQNALLLVVFCLIYNVQIWSKPYEKFGPGMPLIPKLLLITPLDTSSLNSAEKNDLASFKKVLKVQGLRFSEVSVTGISSAKLSEFSVLIVPSSAAKIMNQVTQNAVLLAVKSGCNLLTDGISPLTQLLGIQLHVQPNTITRIHDTHFSENSLYWTIPGSVQTIDNSVRNDSLLAYDELTHQPIAVTGHFGNGRFVYLSPLFDPNTSKGYSRFPFLIEWMESNLGIFRFAERQAVEMYFDPGMRDNKTYSIDSLARIWRDRKIKRIYAAGWYYDGSYDYAPLFKACHSNGIQVYCWLETPEITDSFWVIHPEWREKTATGRDAAIDWRKLMNLADKDCRKQVIKELDDLLMRYDWDGVNFAEMYFEPHPAGFENPNNFTPMNSIVRNEFKNQSGFDPIQLFDTASIHYWKKDKISWRLFADYRKKLSYQIKCHFLDFLTTVKSRKGGFDIMLTGIDVSLQPEESDNIGESTELTLDLYKKYPMTLQIEDPSNCWGTGPERYEQLGRLYRKTVKDKNRLAFDCNVVGSHEQGSGGFPSEKPSGEEIRQITYNMLLHQIRPAFYAEDAVFPNDFKNINTVLAREASITEEHHNEWKIKTPYTILVVVGNTKGMLTLDNKPWHAGSSGEVIIPQGTHILSMDTLSHNDSKFRLTHLTGELKRAKFSNNKLEFEYAEEVTSCYAIINRKPSVIYIDGKKSDIVAVGKEEFSLRLPQGKHKVKIE